MTHEEMVSVLEMFFAAAKMVREDERAADAALTTGAMAFARSGFVKEVQRLSGAAGGAEDLLVTMGDRTQFMIEVRDPRSPS